MVARRNVRESEFRKAQSAIKVLQTAAPLNNSSVTAPDGQVRIGADGNGGKLKANGEFEWRGQMETFGPWDNSGDITNSGGLSNSGPFQNSGSFTNTGPMSNSGTFTNTGPLNNSGKLTQNGDADLNGNTKITGNTEITGVTTLKNDLNVDPAGKVHVGSSMTLNPTVASGAIVFSNGAQVFTNGDTIQVYLGNGVVQISNSEARLQLGGSVIRCTVDGVQIIGGLNLSGLPTTTVAGAPAGLLAIDGGVVKRTV
jgi:hypothetical protein